MSTRVYQRLSSCRAAISSQLANIKARKEHALYGGVACGLAHSNDVALVVCAHAVSVRRVQMLLFTLMCKCILEGNVAYYHPCLSEWRAWSAASGHTQA
jgi:hypothetical protein